jgi:hypothetical protein
MWFCSAYPPPPPDTAAGCHDTEVGFLIVKAAGKRARTRVAARPVAAAAGAGTHGVTLSGDATQYATPRARRSRSRPKRADEDEHGALVGLVGEHGAPPLQLELAVHAVARPLLVVAPTVLRCDPQHGLKAHHGVRALLQDGLFETRPAGAARRSGRRARPRTARRSRGGRAPRAPELLAVPPRTASRAGRTKPGVCANSWLALRNGVVAVPGEATRYPKLDANRFTPALNTFA